MHVLIACEFSGLVRQAFRALGHDAWSCDLLPAEDNHTSHIQGEVRDHLENWDMIIAHPPCTYLASSGARWWKDKFDDQLDAIAFVHEIAIAPCLRIAIENGDHLSDKPISSRGIVVPSAGGIQWNPTINGLYRRLPWRLAAMPSQMSAA